MMRKAIRGHIENNPSLEKLLPCLKGNVGFVFTKGDLNDVRTAIADNKVKAPARAGAIAPLSVVVPKQNTGMGPEKTSFFQALNIQTKITKGTVEILNDVKLLDEGDKVGPSEAALLNMLNISPFSYGLAIERVYEAGTVYDPAILDINDEDLCSSLGGERIQEPVGYRRRDGVHVQASRDDQGLPGRSICVRLCCTHRCGHWLRPCRSQGGREE